MSIYLYTLPYVPAISSIAENDDDRVLKYLCTFLIGVYILSVIVIVNLVGMIVTPEFQANFGESSYKYVLLYSLAINMVIFEIFNKKKTKTLLN